MRYRVVVIVLYTVFYYILSFNKNYEFSLIRIINVNMRNTTLIHLAFMTRNILFAYLDMCTIFTKVEIQCLR